MGISFTILRGAVATAAMMLGLLLGAPCSMAGEQGEAKRAQVQKAPAMQEVKVEATSVKPDIKEMMQKLKPTKPAAGDRLAAEAPDPPRYEIADCGTESKPVICCSYTEGDEGSTCNLFKLLCKNAGWNPEGGADAATCSAP